MTFCPRAPFFRALAEMPTARIAMGIAASKTCPIFRPEYAAAAEKRMAMKIPQPTDHGVTSGCSAAGSRTGRYSSPGGSSLYALSGRPVVVVLSCSMRKCSFDNGAEAVMPATAPAGRFLIGGHAAGWFRQNPFQPRVGQYEELSRRISASPGRRAIPWGRGSFVRR